MHFCSDNNLERSRMYCRLLKKIHFWGIYFSSLTGSLIERMSYEDFWVKINKKEIKEITIAK